MVLDRHLILFDDLVDVQGRERDLGFERRAYRVVADLRSKSPVCRGRRVKIGALNCSRVNRGIDQRVHPQVAARYQQELGPEGAAGRSRAEPPA